VNASGCSGTTDELKCLRSKDTTALQLANVPHPYPGHSLAPLFYWTPTIDGDFIQDYPYCLFEQGRFVKVPIIFGGNAKAFGSYQNNANQSTFKTIPMKVRPSQPMPHLQQPSQHSCKTTIHISQLPTLMK
jgi:hypothetical protein